jgi:cell division protein FtsI (penicillin-binding protein 3)
MKNLSEGRVRFMRARIALLAVVLFAGAFAIVKRAWDLQVRQAPELREMAEQQYHKGIQLSPKRGTIYDRNGAELAVSVEVDSLYVDPKLFREAGQKPLQVAARLSALLGIPRKAIADKLAAERNFAWIKRRLSPSESKAVRALNIPGIVLRSEARRYYPNRELASHVLGFADVDGRGLEGLELQLDERLRGSSALVPAVRDRRGKVVFSDLSDDTASQGDDVTLSLDKTIQHFAERELELTVRTFEAKSGSAVALDPRTGEILAMANYPTFNPNQPGSAPVANRRNRSITDRFEPGSTIKAFTVAGALTKNPTLIDASYDCEQGLMRRPGFTIRDTHPWGELTPTEILVHSSNIGAAKIGMEMGGPALYRTLRDFGFGAPTGVGLPGEVGGALRDPKLWYEADLTNIAFGQGLSVSALQLASSMGALANQGRLLRPTLVKRIETARGEAIPQPLAAGRQVVPPQVAKALTHMLTAVIGQGGTGTEAAIDGVPVAGKTGTAQKPDHVRGGYAEAQWLASFVGFAPADDPRLVLAVVIDDPVIDYYGGVVAAPAFRRIMQASLRHMDVLPSAPLLAVEPRIVATPETARAPTRSAAAGDVATAALAAAANRGGAEAATGRFKVPDLLGQTTRAALIAAREAGLDVDLRGSGVVVAQRPTAGELAQVGMTIEATLAPPKVDAALGAALPAQQAAAPASRVKGGAATVPIGARERGDG